MSSLAARSRGKRKSLGHSLGERNLNTAPDDDDAGLKQAKGKAKMRSNKSIGGGEDPSKLTSSGKITFSVGQKAPENLSPRSQARRKAVPRKSILKSFSAGMTPQLEDEQPLPATNQEATLVEHDRQNLTFQSSTTLVDRRNSLHYAASEAQTHTYGSLRHSMAGTSGRPSMGMAGRRVSFAPSAHVRMYDSSANREPRASMSRTNIFAQAQLPAAAPAPAAAPRPSTSAHLRRSSIQNIASVMQHANNAGGGEESMDIEDETDSEADASGEDDEDEVLDRVEQSMYRAAPASPEDDEEEMSMEVTQNFGGGIISHQGMHSGAQGDESVDEVNTSEANTSTQSDMDFTVAIGGILPTVPPTGAQRGRASLGYSHILHDDGDFLIPGEGDDDEMEMDETVAFGGIIQADDSLSSMEEDTMTHQREPTRTFSIDDLQRAAAEERLAMDMTVAAGGILSQSQTLAVSQPARQQPPTPKSPRSITRPMAGTPSFARPTASSASKCRSPEKRNIFGPSPSPHKSSTPRKSGMQTAAEVAKRLSFGSATSSVHGSAKKRPRRSAFGGDEEEEGDKENEEPASQRPRLGDSIFGRPSLSRAGAPPTPVRSTPAKLKSTTPAKSPARSPAIRRAMGVPDLPLEEERDEDWEPATIGVGAFLEMAGVQFIDTLPGMNRRRSSVARNKLAQSALARDRDFAPYEYTDAKVHSVFLNMYNWATGRIKSDITSGEADLASTESIYSVNNPSVIKEYLAANDDDKQLFELTFKTFKTHMQLKAREKWYDWKHGVMENIRPNVEEIYAEVKQDEERLDEMNAQADTFLPQLRDRARLLREELQRERAVVAEIEACDQAELAEWRAVINEQKQQVDTATNDVREKINKLETLKAKLADLTTTKTGHESAIALARTMCDQHTKSDVARIRREYESLQTLHRWKVDFLRADRFEMTYADEIRLSFDCAAFVPDLDSWEVVLLKQQADQASHGLYELLKASVAQMGRSKQTLPQVVQRVGSLWASARRLREELMLLTLRHPVSTVYSADTTTLAVSAIMMIRSLASKVRVQYHLTPGVLAGFPASLGTMTSTIEVIYGPVDPMQVKAKVDESMLVLGETGYSGAFSLTSVAILEEFDGVVASL